MKWFVILSSAAFAASFGYMAGSEAYKLYRGTTDWQADWKDYLVDAAVAWGAIATLIVCGRALFT